MGSVEPCNNWAYASEPSKEVYMISPLHRYSDEVPHTHTVQMACCKQRRDKIKLVKESVFQTHCFTIVPIKGGTVLRLYMKENQWENLRKRVYHRLDLICIEL